MADLHIGDNFCDIGLIEGTIEHIITTPNAYLILNGDLLNNATKTSVSDSYAEKLSPMKQISTIIELLTPIRDKIICINSGNHERRTYIKEGIDLMEVVARELGLYHLYSRASSFIFLRFGREAKGRKNHRGEVRKICYTIYANHGTGGGRKAGSKINRLEAMSDIVDADIYIHSHTHLPAVMKQDFLRPNIFNSIVTQVTQLFVNTSATLNYGGYGEEFEYKPSAKDTPTIYLNGTKKEMFAKL
jgi:predicted phosphodiesterase